jgi:hypothetical protein
VAPEEELPAREPGREGRAKEHDMSERLVFDLSGIDWDDEESIKEATRTIWEISVARMGGTVPEIEQPKQPEVILTERFAAAVGYATALHAQQARKGTTIPYASHLLGVAALVSGVRPSCAGHDTRREGRHMARHHRRGLSPQ